MEADKLSVICSKSQTNMADSHEENSSYGHLSVGELGSEIADNRPCIEYYCRTGFDSDAKVSPPSKLSRIKDEKSDYFNLINEKTTPI